MNLKFPKYSKHQILFFHYGVAIAVFLQLAEDLLQGQGKCYTGEFFPWRQYVDYNSLLGFDCYYIFVFIEIALLVLFVARKKLSLVAPLLALIIFMDNLGSFLNHRLLIAIAVLFSSFSPQLEQEDSDKSIECIALDLVRWQLSLVYFTSGIHKLNQSFLSGESLKNLFWMLNDSKMQVYPDWAFSILQSDSVCQVFAIFAVALELSLPFLLYLNSYAKIAVILAILMHLSFAVCMPHIWIFTLLMVVALVSILPDDSWQFFVEKMRIQNNRK